MTALYHTHYSNRPTGYIVKGQSSNRRSVDQARMRILCIVMLFGLSFFALGMRLVEVTLVGGEELPFKKLISDPKLLLEYEEKQKEFAIKSESFRKNITDRNHVILATDIDTKSLVANTTLIKNISDTAHALHSVFPDISLDILHKKLHSKSSFTYIKRHLGPNEQYAVNILGIPGLFFEPDHRRIYPYGELVSHILGYVSTDNTGISGIERFMNDALVTSMPHTEDVVLSLDMRIQSVVYTHLKEAIKEFHAKAAVGVVSDIQTGEIISMVNLPSFNPNMLTTATDDQKFNRATKGLYELGSIFKAFTMANAFEHNILGLSDGYDITHPINAGGYVIRDYHPMRGWHNVREIFAESSNIGTVKAALDIGIKRQKSFLNSLGMLQPVSLEITEKATPIFPKKWNRLSSMTISYGHGISVTPLHVVQAMATITGDGIRRPLTLIKKKDRNIDNGQRVVSESSAIKMRTILHDVVQYGTARKAQISGYQIGGKTGTAEKIINGKYNDDAKITSFLSVFPIKSPRYVMLIMIDEPQGNEKTFGYATGGWIAAPVAGKIIDIIAPMLGLSPLFEMEEEVPPTWAQAKNKLEKPRSLNEEWRIQHASF